MVRPDHDYLLEAGQFPCNFSLDSVDKITISRLRYVRHNLATELELGHDCPQELVRKKNFLTLVEFRLGDRYRALELNEEVVSLTNWTNVSSLGNRCFLMVSFGDEPEAKKCLKILNDMKKHQDTFETLVTDAIAEQAYCYSRLGGSDNIRNAIALFKKAVQKKPENYLWKFGLGLVYRRATHTNIYCSSLHPLDVEDCKKMAARYLFEVGDNAESNFLRAMAYAQLVKLRQDLPSEIFPQYNSLFRYKSVRQLCDKALEFGSEIPTVLTQCGRCLQSTDLNRAIDLLEKSVSFKKNTVAYHQLGSCYKKKAEIVAQLLQSKSFVSNHQPCQDIEVDSAVGVRCEENFYTYPHQAKELSCKKMFESTRNEKTETWLNLSKNTLNSNGVSHSYYGDSWNTFDESITIPVPTAYLSDMQSCSAISKCVVTNEKCVDTVSNKTKNQSTPSVKIPKETSLQGWHPVEEVRMFASSSSGTPISLDRNDQWVKKAIDCYEQAIRLSSAENLPAILDLGILLKQTGQLRQALTYFNRVTNSQLSLSGHRVTVITAFEQAGLCYLELSRMDNTWTSFAKDGKKKLTKAVSLAADLAVSISELKDCARNIWLALKTLLLELNERPQFPVYLKEKIQLLELVRDHGAIIEVVQNFRELNDDQLEDPDVVSSALTSYLELDQPEDALAFQNLVGIGPGVRGSSWWNSYGMRELRSNVLLKTASSRMKETSENSCSLFQQLFQLTYGTCVGCRDQLEGEGGSELGPSAGDVLFVCDEDTEMGVALATARCLALSATSVFGLESSVNLQACGEYGLPTAELQLTEMEKYPVVVLVLGDEDRDRMFEAMLERVPYIQGVPHQRILVIDAGLTNGQVPKSLRHYPCLKLSEIVTMLAADLKHDLHPTHQEILLRVFDSDVDAVLKLFCFIIGTSWPNPRLPVDSLKALNTLTRWTHNNECSVTVG